MQNKIRVKLVSKNKKAFRLFHDPAFHHDDMEWVLNEKADSYDWLVVYDDLPPEGTERLSMRVEDLPCPQSQTILLTYEPSSVKFYGHDYVQQFGQVLTSHETDVLKHPNRHFTPPVGVWYYGTMEHVRAHAAPPEKTADVSMFMSKKAQKHTLHNLRADFMTGLAERLGDRIDLFGRDLKFVEHKAEGTDQYRYQIAVENHIAPHHWTEKISDAFLGYCLPFYFGCPNVSDYFPSESFIGLDILDLDGSVEVIKKAVADGEYEKRRGAVVEARRRVLEDYSLHNILARHVLAGPTRQNAGGNRKIFSRHAMMRRDVLTFARYARDKISHRRRTKRYYLDFVKRAGRAAI